MRKFFLYFILFELFKQYYSKYIRILFLYFIVFDLFQQLCSTCMGIVFNFLEDSSNLTIFSISTMIVLYRILSDFDSFQHIYADSSSENLSNFENFQHMAELQISVVSDPASKRQIQVAINYHNDDIYIMMSVCLSEKSSLLGFSWFLVGFHGF